MMYLFTLIYDVLVYSQIIHSTNPTPFGGKFAARIVGRPREPPKALAGGDEMKTVDTFIGKGPAAHFSQVIRVRG